MPASAPASSGSRAVRSEIQWKSTTSDFGVMPSVVKVSTNAHTWSSGWASLGVATNVPRPCRRTRCPSSTSTCRALRTVVRLIPYRAVSCG